MLFCGLRWRWSTSVGSSLSVVSGRSSPFLKSAFLWGFIRILRLDVHEFGAVYPFSGETRTSWSAPWHFTAVLAANSTIRSFKPQRLFSSSYFRVPGCWTSRFAGQAEAAWVEPPLGGGPGVSDVCPMMESRVPGQGGESFRHISLEPPCLLLPSPQGICSWTKLCWLTHCNEGERTSWRTVGLFEMLLFFLICLPWLNWTLWEDRAPVRCPSLCLVPHQAQSEQLSRCHLRDHLGKAWRD